MGRIYLQASGRLLRFKVKTIDHADPGNIDHAVQ